MNYSLVGEINGPEEMHTTLYWHDNQTFHGGWLLAKCLNIFSVVIIRTQKHTDRQTVENTVWIAL